MEQPPDTPTRPALRPTRLSAGLLAGGVTVAMVLAGLGIASAQSDEPTTTTTTRPAAEEGNRPHRHGGRHLEASRTVAAEVLGIPVEDLRSRLREGKSLAEIAGAETDELIAALVAAVGTHLDDDVAEGRLTQEQADRRKANLEERVTAFVHRTRPAPGDSRPGRHPGAKATLSVAAGVLGLSEDGLRAQLRAGTSLATIAGDRTPALVDALVAAATTRIDAAVAGGRLTPAQADERKANLTERITALVHRTPGEGHRRGHHRPPRPGAPAPADGDAEAAPASVTTSLD
ncbi:MAG TPA: hypothetical protein VM933_01360 [Acidimicrobiales bacterium]|nr:hypothetical protein [Acidimicrobiales bacterium]